jgi:DNA-binding PadR family transcriptional regulator
MMARRAPQTLRPLDEAILAAAFELLAGGTGEFHGYQLARQIEPGAIVGHTTLYRALAALEKQGLLTSYWESSEQAAEQKRPPRCYYRLNGAAAELAYRSWPRVQTARQFPFRQPAPAV